VTGPAALVAVIVLTLVFDYTNGFHDAASAVSTRALTLRAVLLLAAVMNLAGALLSTGIAGTVAKRIIDVVCDGVRGEGADLDDARDHCADRVRGRLPGRAGAHLTVGFRRYATG
jgi:chromate transport protein ChrA